MQQVTTTGIHWNELNGRKTSFSLHPDMLHSCHVRSVACHPVPHCLAKPRGTYTVQFDRMFAIEKIRELVIAPLKSEPLESILLLVAEAYAIECPDAPVVGGELLSILTKTH